VNLQEKSDIINALFYDLKAEFVIAVLLTEGMSQNDITAVFDGILKRKWSTDINYTEVEKFESGDEVLSIHLNRPGIYDGLPEALFHSLSDSRNATGEDMAKESMRLKSEEKQVRLFLRPFENEIFFRTVNVAIKENLNFKDVYSDFLDGLIPGFWKIDNRIPEKYSCKLSRLLPFAHQLAGDYDLTAECLEFILGEKVEIELLDEEAETEGKLRVESSMNDFHGSCLGNSKLGYDTIAGQTASGFIGKLIVRIGPLKNTDPKDFFKGGPADRALNCFYGYFMPIELDVETKIKAEKEKNNFILEETRVSELPMSYLGYNTAI
jgi:hypothetical protein